MSHGKFFDKIVETWDICDFFFPCLTPFLLSWSTLLCLPAELSAGSHAEEAPFLLSASTPWASDFAWTVDQLSFPVSGLTSYLHSGVEILQHMSFRGPGWSEQLMDITQKVTQLWLCVPDHGFTVTHMEEQAICCLYSQIAFPHLLACCLGKTGLFSLVVETHCRVTDVLSSHRLSGVQPWSNTSKRFWDG